MKSLSADGVATLVVGAATVLMYVWLALISWLQAKILQKQVALQKQQLNQAAFDNRFNLYKRFGKTLALVIDNGSSLDSAAKGEIQAIFDEARFLYSKLTIAHIGVIQALVYQFIEQDHRLREAKAAYDEGEEPLKIARDRWEKSRALLVQAHGNLATTFDELRFDRKKLDIGLG